GSYTGLGKILLTAGTAPHPLGGSGSYTNIELNDASFGVLQSSATVTVTGVLTLTTSSWGFSGTNTLNLNGTLAGAGTFAGASSVAASVGTIVVNGSGSLGSALTFASGNNFIAGLTINRLPNGSVTLGSPVNIGSTALGALTMTSGTLVASSTNYPTVNNT